MVDELAARLARARPAREQRKQAGAIPGEHEHKKRTGRKRSTPVRFFPPRRALQRLAHLLERLLLLELQEVAPYWGGRGCFLLLRLRSRLGRLSCSLLHP